MRICCVTRHNKFSTSHIIQDTKILATTRQNFTTGRTINECARFICTQNNLQSGYNGHSAQVYGKGVLEGPEIPTCVELPYRKYLPVSVQVERRLATAVSYVTRQMATGAPAWAPADAISSATWQTDTGVPARAPASQCHLIRHVADGYWRTRSGASRPTAVSSATWQTATGMYACHVYRIHYSWRVALVILAGSLATLLQYD